MVWGGTRDGKIIRGSEKDEKEWVLTESKKKSRKEQKKKKGGM